MEFLIANLAPIMFATLVLFLLLGFPVAFALAANGILYGLVGIELDLLSPALFQALPQRVFGIISNDTLLAVPFFTLMGLVLERSGMAEDLLETIGQVSGPVRGGLAIAVVFVGAMLAATTGVVSASVISMGLISLPIMLRYGYDRRLASGVIAASGTLSQIIPPSLVLIIWPTSWGARSGTCTVRRWCRGSCWRGCTSPMWWSSRWSSPRRRRRCPRRRAGFASPTARAGGVRCWC
ncbi:TRAP transporter, DctM-like membrane domain protein [Bordetella bronchiseptica 980-2]|nr:TRAP transporter, DctM-like membrane domain protein [Bordetella bronchiseptica 980-2]